MEANQVLTGSEFVWVKDIKALLSARICGLEILRIELLCHGAPDLHALNIGNVAITNKVEPISLVELGPNKEVQVLNELVLANQCSSKSQLAMRVGDGDDLAEHLCWNHMHLHHACPTLSQSTKLVQPTSTAVTVHVTQPIRSCCRASGRKV